MGEVKKKPIDKKRIIRRRPKGQQSKKYFTAETQEHIEQYQAEDDVEKKKDIFQKKILPAFDALVENLINVYGFHVLYESKEDLKAECVEFLFSSVHKFNAAKGSKAFSYFNVVAKNWLTIKSKQNVKKLHRSVYMDDAEALSLHDLETIEHYKILPSMDEIVTNEEMQQFIRTTLGHLQERANSENEQLCIDALHDILEHLDNLEILNKRALLEYIRNWTGLNSKQVSVVLSSFKKHYKEIKEIEGFAY